MEVKKSAEHLTQIYRERFTRQEIIRKNKLWQILCADFLQKYVPEDSFVLDIAAGYCEFINNIKAQKKYAIDLNPDTSNYANRDVEVHICTANHLTFLKDGSVDIVFLSNFLEHLPSKEAVMQTLTEIYRVCKPQAAVLILQPNFRYAFKEYWDFFDHRIPLSDKSLAEALTLVGFKIEKILPRFIPFTTKNKLPKTPWLARLYLKLPIIWNIWGKQAFVIARKDA